MRLLFLTMALMCIGRSSVGQPGYVHERLMSGVRGILADTDAAFVNKYGVPCFTTVAPGGYFDAWRYKTNLNATYLGPNSNGYTFGINDAGQVAYKAQTPGTIRVMVDGTDYYSQLFPPDPTQDRVVIRGVDGAGRPFWQYNQTGPDRVFVGLNEISGGLPVYTPRLQGVNRAGRAAWYALTEEGTESFTDIYADGYNLSKAALGPDRHAGSKGKVNDAGDVLWSGRSSLTGGTWDLFLNDQNLTRGTITNLRGAIPGALNNKGDFLWLAADATGHDRLYKNYTDIALEAFGDVDYDVLQLSYYMNDRGNVLWIGYSQANSGVFLDTTNLSSTLLGVPELQRTVGLDRWGNALWSGRGSLTGNRERVYVNQFDLGTDAYGGSTANYWEARAMAIGENGHVLWWGRDLNDTYSVWLSTPVLEPETTAILGTGIVGALTLRRRRK